jgi:hypothetical protein
LGNISMLLYKIDLICIVCVFTLRNKFNGHLNNIIFLNICLRTYVPN